MTQILLSCIIFCSTLLCIMNWVFSHDLNIPQNYSGVQQNKNINYTETSNFSEEHKREFALHDELKEVVLVMGNTGSGKSTLVSALTGQKLKAINTKIYIKIVDEEGRIGTGSSSKTLIPEVIIDNERNVTYIDCSGFRDNRGVEYEKSSFRILNSLMNQVEKIKIILVIDYSSLKDTGYKKDLDDLFESVGEFIKDIPKLRDGIALVATKVENLYKRIDNRTFFLSNNNQSVLDGIADYLKNKQETYRHRTEHRWKYRMFINLIDVLLQKKNDSYTRIAILHTPTEPGLLDDMPKIKNEINTIAKMITENLEYVVKPKNDSRSTFSEFLKNLLHEIGNETLMHYWKIEKQYSDIKTLHEQISYTYNLISGIKDVDTPSELFEEFLNVINTLHISVSQSNVNFISDCLNELQFSTILSNENKNNIYMLLKNKMQTITDFMEKLKNFYDFLNNLQENLAAYNSQKLKNDHCIKNVLESCTNSIYKIAQDIPDLENIVKAIGSDQMYQKIKTLELNRFRLKHLANIFRAFTSKLEFSCSSLLKLMIVKGYNIKMSDVNKINCSKQAESLHIFALNKVFIDHTINRTGAEAQLFIFAPTWEVVGEPKIILDVKARGLHDRTFATSAFSNSFFGIGKQFINLTHLEVHVNGDKKSLHGENGAGLLFRIDQNSKDVKKYINKKTNNPEYPMTKTVISLYSAIIYFKNFVRVNLFENIKESELRTFLDELEYNGRIKAQYNKLDDTLNNPLRQTVFNLPKYLNNITKTAECINKTYYLPIIKQYQDDYKNILNRKIDEANNFIQHTIKPEVDKLKNEFNDQMEVIVKEINKSRYSAENTLETIKKNKNKIRDMMQLHAVFLPLKFAATVLSFFTSIDVMAAVTVTDSISIAGGILFDTTSSQGKSKILKKYILEKNIEKDKKVKEPLCHQTRQLPPSDREKTQKIKTLKEQLQEAISRETNRISKSNEKLKDLQKIADKMVTFTNLNDAQFIFNVTEIIYGLIRKLANEGGMMRKTNDQIFECAQQLKVLENMENQTYDTIIPDLYRIEEIITAVESVVNGSSVKGVVNGSYGKLDLTKWKVQTTLRDLKSLLQNSTHQMPLNLQSNLQRYMEKIDEGFSILIDIYDYIDSYSDSVKQSEYIAHVTSAGNNLELMTDLNKLTEKYAIALHAIKQHYFPFAAYVLPKSQVPTSMQLNDTGILGSNIIDKIKIIEYYINKIEFDYWDYGAYTYPENVFNSDIINASSFYVWKHETIKDEVRQLLNGSEIVIRADISKGPSFNAIKFNDIGINFKLHNEAMQRSFTSVLKHFRLTMTMFGNYYYRCGERYYYVPIDYNITISYNLDSDIYERIYPNDVYLLIHHSRPFLSPYGMWKIKLESVNDSVSFDHLNVYANETIDLELVGRGYYIEQNAEFNFEICNKYLDMYYDVDNSI